MPLDLAYSYYDTPDGQDIFKKMWYTTKIAGATGMMAGFVDVRFFSHTQGFYPAVAKFASYTIPFMGMAAAFTATTCISTNLRHKDDRWNYLWGGIAAGSVCGAWRQRLMVGFVSSVVFGLIGVLKKSSIMEGWEFVPATPMNQYSSLRWARHDFTLTKPLPKQWKKQEDEEIQEN